jgi:type IV pilus assembly protein PilO
MKLSDVQNLDPNNMGSWPGAFKGMAIGIICVAVLGAGFYFDTQAQLDKFDSQMRREQDLKAVFEAKQRKAANLEPLKRQLKEMEQSFGALLRLLPNRTEIEGLLVDISKSGLAAGLEFETFRPSSERPADFYAIQPIEIVVTGDYHKFGEFISAVAALPRIVTVHNINITPKPAKLNARSKAAAKRNRPQQRRLSMRIVAKTYRYVDEEEG